MHEIKNNPQFKKGFTKFDNEILDSLAASKFRLLELKIILTVIRKTDGYHRNEAAISFSVFEKMTKSDRRNIYRAIKNLVNAGILTRRKGAKMKYNKPVYNYSLDKESRHLWDNRISACKTTETIVDDTTIKYNKKILKEMNKELGDNFSM